MAFYGNATSIYYFGLKWSKANGAIVMALCSSCVFVLICSSVNFHFKHLSFLQEILIPWKHSLKSFLKLLSWFQSNFTWMYLWWTSVTFLHEIFIPWKTLVLCVRLTSRSLYGIYLMIFLNIVFSDTDQLISIKVHINIPSLNLHQISLKTWVFEMEFFFSLWLLKRH